MLTPDSFTVRCNGVNLHVTDWGGRGRELLFAHPTGFLGAIWRPVIARLRRAGMSSRILCYDQRGHGLSSKPDQGYQWVNFFDDLEALMDALSLSNVLGVGHSAGATTLACTAAANPSRFRRLVLVDPILIPYDDELITTMRGDSNSMAVRTRTRRLVWASRSELLDSYSGRAPYDTWDEEALRVYTDSGTFERPDGEVELLCPGRIEAQVYENAAAVDPYPKLQRLKLPTLFVRGGRSDSFSESLARKAVTAVAGARLTTIAEATHYVPMEFPDRIAEIILDECGA